MMDRIKVLSFSMFFTLRDSGRSLAWATTILLFGYSTTFFEGASSFRHQYHSSHADVTVVKDGYSRTCTQGAGLIQGNEKVSCKCRRFVYGPFVTSVYIHWGVLHLNFSFSFVKSVTASFRCSLIEGTNTFRQSWKTDWKEVYWRVLTWIGILCTLSIYRRRLSTNV